MAKAAKEQNKIIAKKKIQQILITQPKPGSERSPYFDLEKKYNVQLDFHPFVRVEGFTAKEFRKQKLNLSSFSAVIFVSRNAVDHFFRICAEMKFKVSSEMRYYCASEAVALYLQKFIHYRKRKVFFSADGSSEGIVKVMERHKAKEKLIFPVAERTQNDLSPILEEEGFNFKEAYLYRMVSNEVEEVLKNKYDLIVFFSPFSVETYLSIKPKNIQEDVLIGAFGAPTSKAVENNGLKLSIKAPSPSTPSMVAALNQLLEENK